MAAVVDLLIRQKAPFIFFGAVIGLLVPFWWAPMNLMALSVGVVSAIVVFAIHSSIKRLGGKHFLYLVMMTTIAPALIFVRDVEWGFIMYALSYFVVLSGLHWLARSIAKMGKRTL